ncbi:hypothetical protein O3M35_001856 [Rhynocoris fuscipes]|uniref:Protein kinase domain-containing protein n=1 Tax=Rhynocoris fuscipes TaxID=488301 RepID=A0AAW1CVK6_9HEMI
MTDVCEGLKHMNDNGFIHTDLAARNCLVTSDLTVKIGDYGTSVDMYKNEYYIAGNVAVPIRWCAPETIHCTTTTIETKQVTAPGNVWSLAVVLWEIAEFGKLPYLDLSDEQVIVRVHGEEKYRLPQPECPYGHYLYNIMQICWRSENRASIDQVLSMLYYLKTNPFQESDFETRWKKLKPNTVPVVDNHTPIHSPRHTELAQRPHLQTKSEFDSGVDLEIKPTDDNSCKTNTPMTISPQLSVTSEDIFQSTRKKSPSLTNLQGSLEDVSLPYDSWLQGVDTKTDEDRTFVRNISEAIKNLDETLALEKTSSSSSGDSSLECQNKPLLEFKIGAEGTSTGISGERKSDSSSDTEEETWRHRIERGEFTEKVKEKSKSVTDLMVLTHIDSEESENDSLPSLTRQYSLKRNGNKGVTYTGIGFGSEGNIRNAVLGEELQEKLKSLTLWKTEDQSFLVKRTSDTNTNNKNNFLVNTNSETSTSKQNDVFLVDNTKKLTETFIEKEINENSVFLENENNFLGENTDCVRGENTNYVNNITDNVNINVYVNNSVCTEEIENIIENNETVMKYEQNGINESSQDVDNDVPKIIITESENLDENELNISKENEIVIDIKPRKFIFVCKDETVDELNENKDDEDENLMELNECESTVILGSCEDYTLDYFKGLKTTFSPTEQYSDEESDIKESSSTKEDTVRQLTDTNDDCASPSRDDSTAHVTDDCISPLKDDGLKHIYDLLTDDGQVFDETEQSQIIEDTSVSNQFSRQPISSTSSYENENTDNKTSNVESIEIPMDNENSLKEFRNTLDSGSYSNLVFQDNIEICDQFIKEELKLYNINNEFIINENESVYDKCSMETNKKDSNIIEPLKETSIVNNEHISKGTNTENNEKNVYNKQVFYKNASNSQNENLKSINNQLKPIITNKVSKSKSLESVLCNKNEIENTKCLSNGSIQEFVPIFSLSEMVSEDLFQKQNLNYDSYYSVDSGHGSDRCADQDRQMDDLKTRLEDVVKYGEDYQLHSSEDEYCGKLLTPDDERSSDSGFRDKGSLSESVEDTCDEKYNLEDIDAELEDFNALKTVDKEEVKYYEQFSTPTETETITNNVQTVEGWFLHPKVEVDNNEQQNGWISISTEDDENHTLIIDDEFVTAIRNELKEKLPCAMQTQKSEEDNSPEQEFVDTTLQFTYPAQLSPILEEQESNQSSLLVDDISPILIIPPPDIPGLSFTDDPTEVLESTETPAKDVTTEVKDEILNTDEDVLIVDTETNEVTLIESPKPQSQLSLLLPRKISESMIDDDSTGINSETYILSPNNEPFTPELSAGTNTLSSPEHGNISGMCISPSSIRSDLFDSGPPSLPFDLGQSLEEVEEMPFNKINTETVDILQEQITSGNDVESEETASNCDIPSVVNLTEDIENDECSKEIINDELIEMDTEQLKINVYNFLEAERTNDMLINVTLGSPDKGESSRSSQENLKETDCTPVIVVEDELANQKNKEVNEEKQILDIKSEDTVTEIKPHCSSEQSKWLQELLFTSTNQKDKLSNTQNWPSNDELLLPSTANNENKSVTLRPNNITSTLALMSPDLSSTDSRSHSLLSSFASTPSDDQKLLFDNNDSNSTIKATAPTSLSINTSIINVPMPSPEDADKGWRPTICQLMELTDQAEGEEMTTSFIEPDENGIYTPDWESDASDEQSSSSGEFVWKLQEPVKMERIEEEEEEGAILSDSESDNSSEGSGTEFVPSTWNALATPAKSAIKNPETPSKREKKKVIFKKEKYQCIYEYPREPSDDEDSPDTWQTPTGGGFDYSPFTDWELGDSEMATATEGDSDSEDQRNKPKKNQDYDFYRLDYNIGPHLITDDGDFFISSSSHVLDWCGGDDDGDSEFFPGEFLPSASDITPLNLGELRHTKDSLRLELPLIAPVDNQTNTIVNNTIDSGIDTSSTSSQPSSTTTTLSQQQQQQQMSCAQQSAREDKGEAALLDEQPILPNKNN